MRVITIRDKIKGVLERYINRHGYKIALKVSSSIKVQETIDKLTKLDLNTVSKKEVDDILGKKSWTNLYCHNCLEDITKAIIISETEIICEECLNFAISMLKEIKF